MDRQHKTDRHDCKTQEQELLPSQMSVEQFDEYLSHMSPRQLRRAMREMARAQHNDQAQSQLPQTEILDQQSRLDAGRRFDADANPVQELPQARRVAPPGHVVEAPAPPPPAEPKFYGLNLGIVKLGVTDDGSLNAGVNIGIARVDAKVGLNNRVDAFAGVEDFNAHTGAGVGIGREGLHSDVYAGARAFQLAHADAGFAAAVGPRTGVDGQLSANAGPVRFDLDTRHEIGVNGLYSGVEGRVGVPHAVDFHTDAHLGLNQHDSSMRAYTGVEVARHNAGSGVEINSYGNRVIEPKLRLDTFND